MSESSGAIGENPQHPHSTARQERLTALPAARFDAGETVLRQGTKSGRLMILKNGAVSVLKDGIEIATAAEPGAMFGELSALLDEPHTADVRTIEPSEFHVADANSFLTREPTALLYVATVLARRLDLAYRGLIELKRELAAGAPPSLIRSALEKIESFIRADYPSTGAVHSIRRMLLAPARQIELAEKMVALGESADNGSHRSHPAASVCVCCACSRRLHNTI